MTDSLQEQLSGAIAFELLQRQLMGSEPLAPESFGEPALQRLVAAWAQRQAGTPARPTALDLAVLVRQVLRFVDLQMGSREGMFLRVPIGQGLPVTGDWDRVGVHAHQVADSFICRALPWQPAWLPDVPDEGTDASSAAERPRRLSQAVPGDPFLSTLGWNEYRSAGQRSSVRAALTAPPGATLLICLPTGDGKSSVFQILSQLGYGGTQTGVTVVVVPTTALALDQERSAHRLGICTGQPLAYRGDGDAGIKRGIIDAIVSGTQQLCFASPEAVTGPLRNALLSVARTGLLNALVVDEAHMVETWGTDFRPAFQVLPGVLQEILREARGHEPRTVLLSATLTRQSIDTLRMLFGTDVDGNDRFAVYAAPYLRPEIEYWVAPRCSPPEREGRLLEALLHVPRPAILYTTTVVDAGNWLRRLKGMGFGRVAAVTGKTPTAEREAVVHAWSAGLLDLVVGTSAFGMGIDNAHVRSVIHACIPETLDRFYQEVGRSGRDGAASLSLVLPADGDLDIARSLNRKLTISVEKGLERWSAMFRNPDYSYDGDTNTHLVRLDVPPGNEPDRMDMENARNTEWHIRTLTLMAGAGLIKLMSPESRCRRQDSETLVHEAAEVDREMPLHPYQRLRILETRHLDTRIWEGQVAHYRQQVAETNEAALEAMQEFLDARQCAAELIGPAYDLISHASGDVRVARNCGGCPHCRANQLHPSLRGTASTPFPWPGAPITKGPGLELLDTDNHVIVFYPNPAVGLTATEQRRFVRKVADLMRGSAVHNLISPPGAPVGAAAIQEASLGWPIFWSDQLWGHGLPPGPAVIVMPPNEVVPRRLLRACPPTEARFVFLPMDAADPIVPGVLLRDRYSGRQVMLEQL